MGSCYAESLPGLAVAEISDEAGIEIADAASRVAEWIAADGMMKVVIDPLKVECRVITDENAVSVRHREQPLLEVGEDLQRAECVQATGSAAVRVTQAAGATDGARAEDLATAVSTPHWGD